MATNQTECNEPEKAIGVDWGWAILIISAILWLLTKFILKHIIAMGSPLLAMVAVYGLFALECGVVMAALVVFLRRDTLRKRPRLWALGVGGLWATVRFATFLSILFGANVSSHSGLAFDASPPDSDALDSIPSGEEISEKLSLDEILKMEKEPVVIAIKLHDLVCPHEQAEGSTVEMTEEETYFHEIVETVHKIQIWGLDEFLVEEVENQEAVRRHFKNFGTDEENVWLHKSLAFVPKGSSLERVEELRSHLQQKSSLWRPLDKEYKTTHYPALMDRLVKYVRNNKRHFRE